MQYTHAHAHAQALTYAHTHPLTHKHSYTPTPTSNLVYVSKRTSKGLHTNACVASDKHCASATVSPMANGRYSASPNSCIAAAPVAPFLLLPLLLPLLPLLLLLLLLLLSPSNTPEAHSHRGNTSVEPACTKAAAAVRIGGVCECVYVCVYVCMCVCE